MVLRLLRDRDILINDGLSYVNGTSLEDIFDNDGGHGARCLINIENWSKWTLNSPMVYIEKGNLQYGFQEREIVPSNREIMVAVDELDSKTGTSGILAWRLEDKSIYSLVMWSIPYNLVFYDAYFSIGTVNLSTELTKDLLSNWYKKMYKGDPGNLVCV